MGSVSTLQLTISRAQNTNTQVNTLIVEEIFPSGLSHTEEEIALDTYQSCLHGSSSAHTQVYIFRMPQAKHLIFVALADVHPQPILKHSLRKELYII